MNTILFALPKPAARLASAAAAMVFFACTAYGASTEGDSLPHMVLTDVATGQEATVLPLLRESVGAVVYMQTSCAACRKELLALRELQSRYPKFRVVVVSVDAGNPTRVRRYKEHFGFPFPFLHDPEFATPELFGFSFTPATVLVDERGQIALLKGGYRPGDEAVFEQKMLELMGE